MIYIKLFERVGSFAEDKDIARAIRTEEILPYLEEKQVTLDFENIEGATQSFIHALISDLIRKKGIEVLDKIFFKNCNETVKGIIGIVVEYMQDKEE
ncbi:STAS-like domain-containing protein [Candidatus Woesearchaeota archaeon]|nr:STAS-like domain-containing protein [Candidatus Woesearchaeota archaeon]